MGDRPYFLRATVVGLRAQLEGLGLNSSGLKVDLYLRLTNGGHSLYTDDRDQSDDNQSDSDQSDSDQPDSDQSDSDQPDSDQSDSDQPDSDQSGDDQSDDDQPGDNDGDDGQGNDNQEGSPPGGAGQKRPRNGGGGDDDDDNNGDDNQGSLQPPPRKTLRVGNAIPAELWLQIMGYLNLAQLWNLAMADPAGYLSDDINVFAMDARRQYAIDYPPGNSGDGGSGNPPGNSDDGGSGNSGSGSGSGGSGSGDSGSGGSAGSPSSGGSDDNDDHDDPNRPLSMLQWVGRRLIYDPAFGTAWRARILQLIDTYLQVYGPNDVPYEDGNVIQDMLSYFRVPALHGTGFPLTQAARDERPGIVHLLLLRGVPVDQPQGDTGRTALSEAVGGIGAELNARPSGSEAMHTTFALIGAGADVTLVSASARYNARRMLQRLMVVAAPGTENWHPWPRIVNVRGLSVREFIADPRSDYFDRIRLAMYVIAFQNGGMNYPGLE
ncbi:hypothetical protein LA080_006429 [Diaporthe eres]|nr:hypothetical protein LA080_006429 [Diaporthe eres]